MVPANTLRRATILLSLIRFSIPAGQQCVPWQV